MTMFYHYSPVTGELLSARVAAIDPLESIKASEQAGEEVIVYAQPGQYDTTVEPPEPQANQIPVWSNGAWSLVADYRGETRWTSYTESYVVAELGQPQGTAERPAPPPLTQDQLAAYAADKRWRVATAGIVLPIPGGGSISVPSDDTAYGRLKGAAQDLTAGIIAEPITLVIGREKAVVTLQIVQALYAAISQRWQACYDKQGEVIDAINNGTITTKEEIDAASWPA